jgi:hypothetical protein
VRVGVTQTSRARGDELYLSTGFMRKS